MPSSERSDWIACDCCGTRVPAGLLTESDHFGTTQRRCMTCEGALEVLAARGVEDLDDDKFAAASQRAQQRIAQQSDGGDTLNPVELVVLDYINR